MGVLYARVSNAWVPVSGGGGGLDQATADSLYVNVNGDTMTGALTLNADPTAALGAATKQYVDTRDALYLPLTGGTLTGDLTVATPQSLNFGSAVRQMLNLYATTYALGVQSSTLYFRGSGGNFAWYVGGVHSDTALTPGSGGKNAMQLSGGTLSIGIDYSIANPLRLYGTSDSLSCYLSFYDGSASPTRNGWIGWSGSASVMNMRNESANGTMAFYTNGTGPFIWYPGGAEWMRLIPTSGYLLVGKSSGGAANTVGCELQGTNGVGSFTTDSAGAIALWCAHIGTSNATGQKFATFRDGASGGTLSEAGNINQASATTVNYASGSDYRLKDELGPVDRPAERVKRLRPINFRWRPDGVEMDGFMAHEIAEVVPIAVSGEKDAVDEDGEIIMQTTDNAKLVPLLTAALQDALARIDTLEQRLEAS